jgi:alkanesulfonate monooxygenase SsuD/methylene tetrahydromethanopterin reductase-like flavin-dependent oxidoreductase (luciferase family)
MRIDIQFNPAVEPWSAIREGVLNAEEAGFGTAWVFDHFAGVMLRGTTMLECFTLLGAMAASTTRIELGSLVVNIANRNPGVMAMAAASVQAISGGRLVLGLGAGAAPNTRWSMEHELLGVPLGERMADRHGRFEAVLDELDRWWSDDRAAELRTFPRADPRPPVIVGLNSSALASVAARRTDGINVRGDHERLDHLIDAALEARASSARRDDEMIVSVWAEWDDALADADHPRRRYWEGLGVNRLVMVCLDPHDPVAVASFLR